VSLELRPDGAAVASVMLARCSLRLEGVVVVGAVATVVSSMRLVGAIEEVEEFGLVAEHQEGTCDLYPAMELGQLCGCKLALRTRLRPSSMPMAWMNELPRSSDKPGQRYSVWYWIGVALRTPSTHRRRSSAVCGMQPSVLLRAAAVAEVAVATAEEAAVGIGLAHLRACGPGHTDCNPRMVLLLHLLLFRCVCCCR